MFGVKKLFENPFIKFILIFSGLAILWFSLYHNIYNLDKLFSSDANQVDIQKNISVGLAKYANVFVSIFGYEPTLR